MNSHKFILIMALVATSLISGCNTIHGAGQDIERGGEKIQEKSQ